MTGAEFRTLPPGIVELMLEQNTCVDAWAAEEVARWRASGQPRVVMVRYREEFGERLGLVLPPGCPYPEDSGWMIARSYIALRAAGADVRVVWFDPDAYVQWLDGRPEDWELHHVWAEAQVRD